MPRPLTFEKRRNKARTAQQASPAGDALDGLLGQQEGIEKAPARAIATTAR
jgi:hypothetical protein